MVKSLSFLPEKNTTFSSAAKTKSGWLHRTEKTGVVAEKPIWLPRAYLTRGDLEPARGNVHVCKLVRELTNIQIRTVTAERANDSECSCPTNALQLYEVRKETNERTKEGRKEN